MGTLVPLRHNHYYSVGILVNQGFSQVFLAFLHVFVFMSDDDDFSVAWPMPFHLLGDVSAGFLAFWTQK